MAPQLLHVNQGDDDAESTLIFLVIQNEYLDIDCYPNRT